MSSTFTDRHKLEQFLKDCKRLTEAYKELESARVGLEEKVRTSETQQQGQQQKSSSTEKQTEIDSKGVSEIKELRSYISRLLKDSEPSGITEKTEPNRRSIALPRTEWEAFTNDVRKLVRADEGLLNAYYQLLNAYDQLSKKPAREKRSIRPRLRSLFGRTQTPASMGSCSYCGTDLEPRDKFCRACGRGTGFYSQASRIA